MPYLVFYVNPTPAQHAIAKDVAAGVSGVVENELTEATRVDSKGATRIVKRSADGRNVVREHFVWDSS